MKAVVHPRRACTARVTETGQKASPTGSALHWPDFKIGIFVKALRSRVMA